MGQDVAAEKGVRRHMETSVGTSYNQRMDSAAEISAAHISRPRAAALLTCGFPSLDPGRFYRRLLTIFKTIRSEYKTIAAYLCNQNK